MTIHLFWGSSFSTFIQSGCVYGQCAQQLETDAEWENTIQTELSFNFPPPSHPGLQSFSERAEEKHKDSSRHHSPARPDHQHRRWECGTEGCACMCTCTKKKKLPTLILIFFFLHAGFAAVFEFHKAAKIPDMYSLHSWCGMATLVLFCIQVHTHTHTHGTRGKNTHIIALEWCAGKQKKANCSLSPSSSS